MKYICQTAEEVYDAIHKMQHGDLLSVPSHLSINYRDLPAGTFVQIVRDGPMEQTSEKTFSVPLAESDFDELEVWYWVKLQCPICSHKQVSVYVAPESGGGSALECHNCHYMIALPDV